ncbi:hypothetical protein [Streptomyces mexicanus]|uniref:hypothetical protein n=1 Tax=Streptomyces mexicanus TaxID=178566 RepID=UPI00364F3C0C
MAVLISGHSLRRQAKHPDQVGAHTPLLRMQPAGASVGVEVVVEGEPPLLEGRGDLADTFGLALVTTPETITPARVVGLAFKALVSMRPLRSFSTARLIGMSSR